MRDNQLKIISTGSQVKGSKTVAGNPVKPDIIIEYRRSLLVIIEADDVDGHSGNVTSRALPVELAKMKSVACALSTRGQKMLYIRCNSDNVSKRLNGDRGCAQRASLVYQAIYSTAISTVVWPANSFILAFVDMPPERMKLPGASSNQIGKHLFIPYVEVGVFVD